MYYLDVADKFINIAIQYVWEGPLYTHVFTLSSISGFVVVVVVVVVVIVLSLGQAMQRKLRISSQSHGRNGGMERDEPDRLLDLVAVEFLNGSGKEKFLWLAFQQLNPLVIQRRT